MILELKLKTIIAKSEERKALLLKHQYYWKSGFPGALPLCRECGGNGDFEGHKQDCAWARAIED